MRDKCPSGVQLLRRATVPDVFFKILADGGVLSRMRRETDRGGVRLMENITIPVWVLCGLVGTGFVKDTVKWYRNGRNGRLDPEDRPRKHTELLQGILNEIKGMRKEVREAVRKT